MATWQTVSKRPIFAFDLEAQPGPWAGSDFTFTHLLSMAGRDVARGPMHYVAPGFSPEELEEFVTPLRSGAMALTHNGFRYDLPMLSGSLIRYGLAPLPRVLVTDTYAHLPKRGKAFSASLSNMTRRFDTAARKGGMSEYEWDQAYHGDHDALAKLWRYNTGDVLATISLRKRLLELGLLGPPTWWSPR